MLEIIHKYRRSFLGTLALVFCSVLMLPFGIRELRDMGKGTAAMKVNGHEVSFPEYQEQRRQLEQRYRQMLGANYERIAASINISQQVVDNLQSSLLLLDQSEHLGLSSGDDDVRRQILMSGLFPNGFDQEIYSRYLQEVGMSPKEFEDRIRADVLRQQLAGVVTDSVVPSEREARAAVEDNETNYTVSYIAFEPKTFTDQVKEPESQALEEFYSKNSTDHETPEKVSYEYLVFDPKDVVDSVEVLPEDVEVYYTDHLARFTEPEQVHVRHILLSTPKGADSAKNAAVRERAEKIQQRLVAGETFDKVAPVESEDYVTKDHGGDLGWIGHGKLATTVDAVAFKLKDGGLSDVISTDYGFEIISVEGYRPAKPKELESVRATIESELRAEQAPSYSSAKAYDFFDAWKNSQKSLADFAAEKKMTVVSSNSLLSKDKDPEGQLGLTAKIIANSEERQKLVELGDKVVIASIKEFKDAEIPPLSAVRAPVLAAYRVAHADEVTKEKAQAAADGLAKGTYKTLKDAAQALKLTVSEQKDLGRNKGVPGIFSMPDIQKAVFSTRTPMEKPSGVLSANGEYVILQVTAVTPPDAKLVEEKVEQYRSQSQQTIGQIALASLISQLKAHADVHVDDQILLSTQG